MNMPILPLETLLDGFNDQEKRILSAAFTNRGLKDKSNGCAKLRASKPYADNKIINGEGESAYEMGCANYVWRMLCFDLVGHGKHVCMPVTAGFGLSWGIKALHGKAPRYGQEGYEERRQLERDVQKKLDELVKRFESILPPEAQKGIIRWGRALGMI